MVALLATGCESNLAATEDDIAESELSLLATSLSSDLSLDSEAADGMRAALAEHRHREPGSLWYIAADLQESLTDHQKTRLFQLASNGFVGHRPGGRRGFHTRGEHPRLKALQSVLTEDQLAEVKSLHATFREEMKALLAERRDDAIDASSFREQARDLRDALKSAVDALLTDEQRQQLEELRQEWREDHGGPGRHAVEDAVGAQIWAAMVDALDLDADQQAGVRDLFATHREAVQAYIEEARTGELDREAIREALADLHERFLENLATVLTPEQLETIQIHHALVLRMKRINARLGGPHGDSHGDPSFGGHRPGSNG